jgi:hypothetical protein
MRLSRVIKCINKRYHSATLYMHEQGTRLLKKLKQQQKHLALDPCEACHDPTCGWKLYYSALFKAEYFPCVHEVGFTRVLWYHPEEQRVSVSVADSFAIEEYTPNSETAQIQIPQAHHSNLFLWPPLDDEWHGNSESIPIFAASLATEVKNLSKQRVPYLQLALSLAVGYMRFVPDNEDTPEKRSAFRAQCWEEVRANQEANHIAPAEN